MDEATGDGLARPIEPTARSGAGLDRALVLGGGGLYFVAWQVAYLQVALQAGIDLKAADRVVGTSAGSLVASVLCAGRLGWLHTQVTALGRFPVLLGAMAPATELRPSQVRALTLFHDAVDADPVTIQAIGRAALAAVTPEPVRMRASLQLVLRVREWPDPALNITCVDAYTGERCVVTHESGVHPVAAVAASSAVPGLFSTQPILDRRCMDGGVSGTGLHTDLVAGARRVLVLSLADDVEVTHARMTVAPGDIAAELGHLAEAGGRVVVRTPGEVEIEKLMDPTAVPEALAAGARQAQADLDDLRALWA